MDFLHDHHYHFLFDAARVIVDSETTTFPDQNLYPSKGNHPQVSVRFEEDIVRAVWDTGAGITLVDLSLVEKHPDHFQSDGFSYGTDSAGAKMETPMYRMSAALIGGYRFPPHRVAAVDLPFHNPSNEVPTSLILGYSTLRHANWWFDFPGKKWAITRMLNPIP